MGEGAGRSGLGGNEAGDDDEEGGENTAGAKQARTHHGEKGWGRLDRARRGMRRRGPKTSRKDRAHGKRIGVVVARGAGRLRRHAGADPAFSRPAPQTGPDDRIALETPVATEPGPHPALVFLDGDDPFPLGFPQKIGRQGLSRIP